MRWIAYGGFILGLGGFLTYQFAIRPRVEGRVEARS
jgi:hypothetical protein